MMFVLGLDLGQQQDYSALVVTEFDTADWPRRHDVRYVERFPLGTKYGAIAERVVDLAGARLDWPYVVVDGSGVGRGVVDMFGQQLGYRLVPTTITAGDRTTRDESGYIRVPKKELVAAVQVTLQTRRLRFAAGLQHRRLLTDELEAFRIKVTAAANDTYSAREGAHDDLVLSLALAVWFGEAGWELAASPNDGLLIVDSVSGWGFGDGAADPDEHRVSTNGGPWRSSRRSIADMLSELHTWPELWGSCSLSLTSIWPTGSPTS